VQNARAIMKINNVYNAVNQKAAFKVMFISSTAYSAKITAIFTGYSSE